MTSMLGILLGLGLGALSFLTLAPEPTNRSLSPRLICFHLILGVILGQVLLRTVLH